MKNVIKIIKKELKQSMREKKGNLMMILFPAVLIIILGMAFSGVFNNSYVIDDINVLYTNRDKGILANSFKEFVKHGEEMGILFESTDDIVAGMNSIKDSTHTCYILMESNAQEIRLFKNERFNFNASLVETVLSGFIQRYNAMAAIITENPAAISQIDMDSYANYVHRVSVDKKRAPGSMDYYAVTVLTMILMYASLTGFWNIRGEQSLKTDKRMLSAPVQKHEILAGKVVGGISITIIQMLVVILFSKYVLNAYWGEHIWVILLILLSEVMMTISLGAGAAFALKNEGAAMSVLNTFIPVMVMLGGGYVPLESLAQGGGLLYKLTNISPIKWINQSIFRIIYDNDFSLVPTAIIINLAAAFIFITASSLMYKKEA
jgi:ABC-2 type transport system permease protein